MLELRSWIDYRDRKRPLRKYYRNQKGLRAAVLIDKKKTACTTARTSVCSKMRMWCVVLCTVELDRVTRDPRDARHPNLSTNMYKHEFEEPLLQSTAEFYDSEGYRVLGDFTFIEFIDYVSVRQTLANSGTASSTSSSFDSQWSKLNPRPTKLFWWQRLLTGGGWLPPPDFFLCVWILSVWELWKNNWEGWQIWGEAPRRGEVAFGEGVSSSRIKVGPGEVCPSPEKKINFLAQNSAFWCLFWQE